MKADVSATGTEGVSYGSMLTTADVTFGRGLKARGGTVNSVRAAARVWIMTDSSVMRPGDAVMAAATSRWTMTII